MTVAVRVPATSANLGAGFDVLGMALTLYAEVGIVDPDGAMPDGAHLVDGNHPADVAFRAAGGRGSVWTRSPIPMGRGLGFSGAIRVGGAAAAILARDGVLGSDQRAEVLTVTAELEGHTDNVAASIFGGLVVASGGEVASVPVAFEAMVVVWVPDRSTTSTDRSRAALPDTMSRSDAVFNIGRTALFVAACATGRTDLLHAATEDRIHQSSRVAAVPDAGRALDAARAAGAWAAWLSGSGPTVAAICAPGDADEVAQQLPDTGHVKLLEIDRAGVVPC